MRERVLFWTVWVMGVGARVRLRVARWLGWADRPGPVLSVVLVVALAVGALGLRDGWGGGVGARAVGSEGSGAAGDFTVRADGRPSSCLGWVGLTFDDGPVAGAGGTGEVLAVLRALDVPATFFMVGQEMVLRPGLVRRVLREGHQVGSEGWSHPDMRGLSAAQVNAQLRRTAAVYREITGGGAMSLWRPPYGAESSSVIAAGAGEGLALVLWTVDPKDYARSGLDWVGEVLRIVDGSQGVEDGGVLLLHSGVTATVEALPTIVRAYWSRGLCFGVLRAGGEWRWPVESPGLRYRVSAVEPEGEVG